MAFFKVFHKTNEPEEDLQRERECISRIKETVSRKTGIEKFIDADETAVAFAGSRDNMELMLEISTMKGGDGKKILYATVDDDVSWQEDNFDDLAEFETSIAEYLSNRVEHTVKTVTEINRSCFGVKSYYLNENGEWVLFSDEMSNSKLVCFLAKRLSAPCETVKNYKLEITE